MIDPEQLLSQYEGKLAQAQAKSDAIRENLAHLQVTERSPDGQITVTVNDAGNLVAGTRRSTASSVPTVRTPMALSAQRRVGCRS